MNIEQTINKLKAKPILFQTDMIRDIREDRKTETRRIIKPQPIFDRNYLGNRKIKINKKHYISINYITNSPYGKSGNYLWCRETWCNDPHGDVTYLYREQEKYSEYYKWKPSIYMPKSACRLILKIEDLGVERIQNIDSVSAINEGIEFEFDTYRNYLMQNKTGSFVFGNPIDSFKSLFISIYSKESWDKNVFVWRIKFSKYIQK